MEKDNKEPKESHASSHHHHHHHQKEPKKDNNVVHVCIQIKSPQPELDFSLIFISLFFCLHIRSALFLQTGLLIPWRLRPVARSLIKFYERSFMFLKCLRLLLRSQFYGADQPSRVRVVLPPSRHLLWESTCIYAHKSTCPLKMKSFFSFSDERPNEHSKSIKSEASFLSSKHPVDVFLSFRKSNKIEPQTRRIIRVGLVELSWVEDAKVKAFCSIKH